MSSTPTSAARTGRALPERSSVPRRANAHARAPAVGFVSLGCPKALVDSERLITDLKARGYDIVGAYREADLVIVNTCGFIEAAIDESLEAIGEALQNNARVLVTGCLGARPERILERHPAVLGVTGPHSYQAVIDAVDQHLPRPHDPFADLVPPQGVRLTPRHYAYLKISEGCNNRCSFCIIPSLRGPLRSRPLHEVMREAEALVASGVKELLVISQDTSAYGSDLAYPTDRWRERSYATRFVELARALATLGVWVRLHYVYPYPHVDEIFALMNRAHDGTDSGVLPYLDVPFQHASPAVLRRMRRPAHAEDTLRRIQAWRRECPQLVLRSTFIVGFPGESDREFEELLEWLEEAQLDRVGCFQYSPVQGARANALADPVPEALKAERHERFMQKAAQISQSRLRARVGTDCRVLIDSKQKNLALARSSGEAPQIDGIVRIEDARELAVGQFASVRLVSSDSYDLSAKLLQI